VSCRSIVERRLLCGSVVICSSDRYGTQSPFLGMRRRCNAHKGEAVCCDLPNVKRLANLAYYEGAAIGRAFQMLVGSCRQVPNEPF